MELLAGGNRFHGTSVNRLAEIILFPQLAVDVACNLSRGWPFHAPSIPTQQNRQRDSRMRLIGVTQEPADARRIHVIVAGARLSQRSLLAARVGAEPTCAIKHRGQHAFAHLGKNVGDVQVSLDARLEIVHFILRMGILQIVERATVCERRGLRRKLQRSYLNAFSKTGHPGHAAKGRRLCRERTRMLFGKIVTGQFPEPEQTPVA